MKYNKTVEAKFQALFLHRLGFTATEIGEIQGIHRTTVYHRVWVAEGWLRIYPDMKERYEKFVGGSFERRVS